MIDTHLAAVSRPSPVSRPWDSAIFLREPGMRARATMAGMIGQATQLTMEAMSAPIAVPSVCCGGPYP
jgi:hypothetical protein